MAQIVADSLSDAAHDRDEFLKEFELTLRSQSAPLDLLLFFGALLPRESYAAVSLVQLKSDRIQLCCFRFAATGECCD